MKYNHQTIFQTIYVCISETISNLHAIPLNIHSNDVSKSGSIAFVVYNIFNVYTNLNGSVHILISTLHFNIYIIKRGFLLCVLLATLFPKILHTTNYYILKYRIQSSNYIPNHVCVHFLSNFYPSKSDHYPHCYTNITKPLS